MMTIRLALKTVLSLVVFIVAILLAACGPAQPPVNDTGLLPATPVPTLDAADPDALCTALDNYWSQDWRAAIRVLELLQSLEASCGDDFDITQRFYDAYFSHGVTLEQGGQQDAAITAYQQALTYSAASPEVINALERLGVHIPPPLPVCSVRAIDAAFDALPEYTPAPDAPTSSAFIRVVGDGFVLSDQSYRVYGINYYPRDYPYHRFLTEMDVDRVDLELELMRDAGINTLRTFLRHDDLFQCPGSGAIPIPENIARLDEFIQHAANHDYRLILVLNQDADLIDYPLYGAPEHTMAQIAFIAQRYREEPAILAYDLRDRGDVDYTGMSPQFERAAVLQWLAQAALTMRANAPNQLVTAGWDDDSAVTDPIVDFVSFEHFGDVEALRREIALLTAATDKPILLEAMGYSTYEMDELAQRTALQQALDAVQRNGLSGWVIWTAFDYPLSVVCVEPDCPGENSAEVHFGLWNTSYFPKRALSLVRIFTGAVVEEDDE